MLHQADWPIASSANTVLYGPIQNPHDIITAARMYTDKINFFYGFCATAVIRVQVNPQRFQQGRLLLHYLPFTGGSGLGVFRASTANANLVLKTQQPRVELDLGTDTECILKMPYVFPYEVWKTDNTQFGGSADSLGAFYLSVYSPLVSPSGDTSVSYTIWAHFEDVELIYPSSWTAQANDFWEPQSGGAKGKRGKGTQSERELDAAGQGAISSLFGKLSAAASIVSEVPILSPFATPVAWGASIVSRAASALGFSNPSTSAPVERMIMQRTAYLNNYNAVDNSNKMGLASDNTTELLPGFAGSVKDEGYIKHMATIPCYVENFTWHDTDAAGTLLWWSTVSPMSLSRTSVWTNGSAVNTTVTIPSPAAYLANFFRFWRGGICYTFKVVKTEFHSGRLMLAWFPGVTVAPTYASAQTVYREVFDLRDANEFTAHVPFVSQTPWLGTVQASANDLTRYTGVVALFVINELRAPSTSAQTVDVIVEGAAGPDIEFAFPDPFAQVPALGVFTPQARDFWSPQAMGVDETESGDPQHQHLGQPIVTFNMLPDNIDAAKYCVGESVLSIRQLMKRATVIYSAPQTGPGFLHFQPYLIELPYIAANADADVGLGIDYFSAFMSCFAYSRGGIRLKAWDSSGLSANYVGSLTWDIGSTTYGWQSNSLLASNPLFRNAVFVQASQTGALEVEVPQYYLAKCRPNQVTTTGDGASAYGFNFVGRIDIGFNGSGTVKPIVYRQVSDDFDFGFFYGCPLLIPQSAYSGSTGAVATMWS